MYKQTKTNKQHQVRKQNLQPVLLLCQNINLIFLPDFEICEIKAAMI